MDAADGWNNPAQIVDKAEGVQVAGNTQRAPGFRGPSPVANQGRWVRFDKVDKFALIAEDAKLLGLPRAKQVSGWRTPGNT